MADAVIEAVPSISTDLHFETLPHIRVTGDILPRSLATRIIRSVEVYDL
jgi:hypothetical protein